MIWFTSDHHFNHQRIRQYENRPVDHVDRMWEGFKRIDRLRDTLVYVGDLYFGPTDQAGAFLVRLPGQKRVLIEGNHDKRTKLRNAMGWAEIYRYKKVWRFTHDDVTFSVSHRWRELEEETSDIRVHGHSHGSRPATDWKDGKLWVNVSVEVWNYAPTSIETILGIYRNA